MNNKVVVLENDKDSIEVIKSYLSELEDVEIDKCFDEYSAGLEYILESKPQVVLLALANDVESSKSVLESLAKNNINVVVISANYTTSLVIQMLRCGAKDFLSKPLLYRKVENILNKIYKKKLLNAEEKLFLKCHDGLITLQLSDIIYIQTENKLLILHTIHGDVQSSQRMNELEKRLSTKQFYRCHNSYMVNFDYVEGVKQDSVLIKDKAQKLKTIPVSKYKKEEFMRALARYVGKWEN